MARFPDGSERKRGRDSGGFQRTNDFLQLYLDSFTESSILEDVYDGLQDSERVLSGEAPFTPRFSVDDAVSS